VYRSGEASFLGSAAGGVREGGNHHVTHMTGIPSWPSSEATAGTRRAAPEPTRAHVTRDRGWRGPGAPWSGCAGRTAHPLPGPGPPSLRRTAAGRCPLFTECTVCPIPVPPAAPDPTARTARHQCSTVPHAGANKCVSRVNDAVMNLGIDKCVCDRANPTQNWQMYSRYTNRAKLTATRSPAIGRQHVPPWRGYAFRAPRPRASD